MASPTRQYETLVFDGSLAGLLSIVFSVFADKLQYARIVREVRFQPSIFQDALHLESDPHHAKRVLDGIRKLEGFNEKLVYACWLFDTQQSDEDIIHLLVRVFREGLDAASDYRDEAIFRCRQVQKKMHREIHRMHAFVRFKETSDGLYLARINPDFDVLPLAITHFEQRYQDQEWLIWDDKRHYGYWFTVGSRKAVVVREAATELLPSPTGDEPLGTAASEDGFQTLWSTYFNSVNIEERYNPKLHRQHVPKRYWAYLTEKSHDATAS